MKMGIWVIRTLNQLPVFTLKLDFQKHIVISDKTLFSVLCTLHSTVLIWVFHRAVLYENMTFSITVHKRRYTVFFTFPFLEN